MILGAVAVIAAIAGFVAFGGGEAIFHAH